VPRSMTGYGLAAGETSGGRVQVEIRTVNHRHFSSTFKLTSALQPLEGKIRQQVRDKLQRGHTTVHVRGLEGPERESAPRLNLDRAQMVVDGMIELKEKLGLPGEIDLSFVARQPEVFSFNSTDTPTVNEEEVLEIVNRAVEAVVGAREREGQSLAGELNGQLEELARLVGEVEDRAPVRVTNERDRLRRAVEELVEERKVDEDRLAVELALLADKLDVTEEIVRLRTHIAACREVLTKNEPIGRELTFLGQEMLRETNTIGSKANDAEIAQAVIDMKCVLEKFREQVENIE